MLSWEDYFSEEEVEPEQPKAPPRRKPPRAPKVVGGSEPVKGRKPKRRSPVQHLLKVIRSSKTCLIALEIEETAQDLRILRAIQSIPQDELQMFFRDCGFTEEMVQQIVELIEEGRPQIEELSTSILRRTWCLVIQILVFCKVMVLLVSAGFFVATLGYDKGSCQFSDFTNGTCQQGNVCNLQIAAWHSEGIAYANQFSPPVASSESGGLKSFETNGPFRCCNFAHQAAQENYIPRDGSVEALGLGVGYGSGTPCCNFYNAQTKVFCDNFGAIQQFSHCPTAPWDCRLKLGSDENGNVVVDELLVWEEPVYVLLLIVAGGILGLMLLVVACGCACRHSERLYACGLVIWRCCRYVQNKIGCCRRCRACCACLCSCLRRLRPGPSAEERQQQRRHARDEQERAREASFKNDLRRSQSFGNLDLTRSSWKNSMRRWSLLGSTPTPKEKEPPKAAKVHARPKRKVKKTRVERLRVREADEDETGGMRTSSSNAEDTSESERSSQASKSENLPVDEIKPWNIEDLVEETPGAPNSRPATKNLQSMLRPIMTPMQPQRRPQIITQKFGLQDPFASTTTSFASGYDTRSSFGAGSMSSGFGSHVAPGGVMAQTFSEGFGLRPAGHHRKLPGERQRQKKRRAKDRGRGRGVHLAGAQTRTAWGGDDLQQKPGTFRRRHSEQ